MKPGIYTLKEDAFIFNAGDRFELIDGSYDYEICDICGNKRKCDWLAYRVKPNPEGKTGFDCCRTCEKNVLVEVKE